MEEGGEDAWLGEVGILVVYVLLARSRLMHYDLCFFKVEGDCSYLGVDISACS